MSAVDVVFLLVRVRMKGTRHVPWFMHSVGGEPNQRLTAEWLIRMRLCKQIPHGCGDIIGFEGILGDTPLEYISRANVLN